MNGSEKLTKEMCLSTNDKECICRMPPTEKHTSLYLLSRERAQRDEVVILLIDTGTRESNMILRYLIGNFKYRLMYY